MKRQFFLHPTVYISVRAYLLYNQLLLFSNILIEMISRGALSFLDQHFINIMYFIDMKRNIVYNILK